ncbi:hypothetical protein AALP_AA5G192200 [Arabis alpina]|uniref:Phragmoplastin interacting protein 1 n=1 Tax=Arabis alpina TaxID=50452 RepID=A0A087GY23_ARAAL|nr:hypothetical protein AALP_AA5G192200 [Arabis alpina]
MVLSNKKLKQKIRVDLVQSLSVSVSETNPDSLSNLQSQSLKELLDSASHKPRLSKREKRRKIETLVGREDEDTGGIGEKVVENGGSSEKTDEKKSTKRKRDDTEEGELAEAEGEDTKEVEKSQKKNKNKKKKKKKKRKTKKSEEEKVEEKVIQVDTEIKEEVEVEDGIVPKKVYIGGIPYQSTEDEIRSYFKSCGVITKVDCKMRPEDGTFSGIAFITFETEAGANRALAFDRAAMGDRFLTIQQYVKTTPSVPRKRTSSGFAPEMVDGYNRIYIGNLAWDTTERDIRRLFSDCVITSVRLGKNKETGEFKGFAHVDFKDSVYVAMALKLDQQVISGRPVKICCALKERPAGDTSTNPTPDETNNVDSYMEEALAVPNEVNNGNYFATTVSTGKIKRRSCYECGEKGHLSTACPKKLQNAHDQANPKLDQGTFNATYDLQNNNGGSYMNETYAATNEANAVSVGKIKRRVCYECGEKGHLSTACPQKLHNTDHTNSKLDHQTVNARPVMPSYDLQNNNGANNESLASAVSIGKIKRRVCYECGEKGHLSTACPQKVQNTDHTNSKLDHQTVDTGPIQQTSYALQKESGHTENNGGSYMDMSYATDPISVAATDGANDESLASAVSVRKIKRRVCYECGEKGHLSSACPEKQQK